MPSCGSISARRVALVGLALFLVSSVLAFGQAGWKTVTEKGFSFKHPADWEYIDLGGDDYLGTRGFLKALSPPREDHFAFFIILFPDFSLDLKAMKMTYKDFMKTMFEGFLKDENLKGLKVEETEAVLRKGRVPGFMVVEAKADANVKAAIACGDLVKGKAALLVVTMDLPADQTETGKRYLDEAEKILASFAFPK